eukprot:scaffold225_cov388-Prasinococcus_capsulatus_cf.AAC.18
MLHAFHCNYYLSKQPATGPRAVVTHSWRGYSPVRYVSNGNGPRNTQKSGGRACLSILGAGSAPGRILFPPRWQMSNRLLLTRAPPPKTRRHVRGVVTAPCALRTTARGPATPEQVTGMLVSAFCWSAARWGGYFPPCWHRPLLKRAPPPPPKRRLGARASRPRRGETTAHAAPRKVADAMVSAH